MLRYGDWKYAVAGEDWRVIMSNELFSLVIPNIVFTALSDAKKYRMENVPKKNGRYEKLIYQFDGKYYLLPRAKEARFRKFVRQLQNGERMENEILSIKTSENA
jgi:hypothetical protein